MADTADVGCRPSRGELFRGQNVLWVETGEVRSRDDGRWGGRGGYGMGWWVRGCVEGRKIGGRWLVEIWLRLRVRKKGEGIGMGKLALLLLLVRRYRWERL